MSRFLDPQRDHWLDYGPFQRMKHDLIRRYLEGWFPKLGFWSGRVVYFDTHAGRGAYAGDNPGSPVVALRTLLGHTARDRLLDNSDFQFVFLERDEENASRLREEIQREGELPRGIAVDIGCDDAFGALRREVSSLRSAGQQMASAFLFVDPYGFSLPGNLLSEILEFGRVELFVNVMWRELDMAICQQPPPGHGQADLLDRLFRGDCWREIGGESMVDRADTAAELLATQIGAEWWTHVRMVPGGQAVRFFLLHLTNHDAGRDLMKECVWGLCPDGSMNVRRSENPDQFFLVEPEPDLAPLAEWVLARLECGPVPTASLKEELLSTVWLRKHLRQVQAELGERGQIVRRDGWVSLASQKTLF